MEAPKTSTSHYKGIFKSTFLFGFVQIFNILTKIATNKIVAVLLGAEGMGIIGIFNTTTNMLKIGAGLGISQSAVRDISEANNIKDYKRFSNTISVTNKIIILTALLGLLITVLFSPLISKFSMGNMDYTVSFIFLGLAVAFGIFTDGQLAVLKGMRRLRDLAKASMLGSAVGLAASAPLYYFLGKAGIVPSLIIAAFVSLIFSSYFVRKVEYQKVNLSLKDVFTEATPMFKMGVSLMLVSFLTSLAVLIISIYIRSVGGIREVGFYNAGSTIMVGYFGIIISALSTDYYPRIAAVNTDNAKLQEELNKQSAVSLVLTGPLMVIFIFLLPYFVTLLFSAEFSPAIDFVRIGIFGILITICSNQVDMILVAKFEIKVFIIISVIYRLVQVILTILLYKYFGLIGAGIAATAVGVIHFCIMTFMVHRLYGIHFNRFFLKLAAIIFLLVLTATMITFIDSKSLKYSSGAVLSLCSVVFSVVISEKYFNLKFTQMIKNKLKI